jgi:hypothetical protein
LAGNWKQTKKEGEKSNVTNNNNLLFVFKNSARKVLLALKPCGKPKQFCEFWF